MWALIQQIKFRNFLLKTTSCHVVERLGVLVKIRRHYALVGLIILLPSLVGWGPFTFFARLFSGRATSTSYTSAGVGSRSWYAKEIHTILAQASNLSPEVLKLGLTAYVKARHKGFDDKQMLTIIDYSKPSADRRLWVVDMKRNKVLFNTWVAHGKNSGQRNATSFSNAPGSLKSSIGVFLTDHQPYIGHNGLSLRVKGLEPHINDNAYRRAIVFHGAWYAAPDTARKYGELGRSWGCPAVSQQLARPLIEKIKDDTVVLAYYPDQRWLSHSDWVAG